MFNPIVLISIPALFVVFLPLANAATLKYNFDVSWVWANPDGAFPRPVIGINGQWPPPRIDATLGDTVIVDVFNSLGNQSTSLHFHGLFMNETSHMDGTSYVSQCAISPGSSFRYEFKVKQPGTYWYHSHEKAQYPDGLRGLFIVNDPDSPYRGQYDDEIVLSLSDWYHEQMPALIATYDGSTKMMGREPVPDGNIINDTPDAKVQVEAGQTYLVRAVNVGGIVGQYLWIQDHAMTVVEIDGVYTKPSETNMIYLATGQRCSFLLKTKASSSTNFPIVSRLDQRSFSMHSKKAPGLDAVACLTYGENMPSLEPDPERDLTPLDDMAIEPLDEEPLLKIGQNISLDIDMKTRDDGILHWMFSDQHYTPPTLPSLFAALSSGNESMDPTTYGLSTQTHVFRQNEVAEISISNKHMYPHPIHLHGHNFQVVHRSGGTFNETPVGQAPMRRDTVVVNGHGSLRLRFKASNPGVWLFHCHMEWHAASGLVATFVEAPTVLQTQLKGKIVQLSADPEKACQAPDAQGEKTESSAKAPPLQQDDVILLTVPVKIAALVATVALLATAIGGYVWYGRRKRAADGSYTLVPMADVDEIPKRHEAEVT